MTRRTIFAVVATILATTFTLEASAWGGFGHRTVAEIAERHLTPKAKANIERYTKGTPLADYSVWLDQVRNNDPVLRDITDGWHAAVADEKCQTSPEIRKKHRNDRDAVTVLLKFTDMFKEREKLSDSTVMFALKCIVHMVGDINCPAHLRYVDCRNDGKFKITYMGKNVTLHKVWDTSVITRGRKGWSPANYADILDTYTPQQIKRATKGWVEDWFEDAARNVRPSITWVKEGDSLDEEFQEKALPLAEMQVRKAGYQLAKYLNTIFE